MFHPNDELRAERLAKSSASRDSEYSGQSIQPCIEPMPHLKMAKVSPTAGRQQRHRPAAVAVDTLAGCGGCMCTRVRGGCLYLGIWVYMGT